MHIEALKAYTNIVACDDVREDFKKSLYKIYADIFMLHNLNVMDLKIAKKRINSRDNYFDESINKFYTFKEELLSNELKNSNRENLSEELKLLEPLYNKSKEISDYIISEDFEGEEKFKYRINEIIDKISQLFR